MSTENNKTPEFKKDVVSAGKIASYTMGPFMSAFLEGTMAILVYYYYEVEIGLATYLVGISIIIYALWNMINDPLIGYLTDKPMRWSKKYGMRTPWIIMGAIITIICYFLIFTAPTDTDVKSNPWPIFWYMVIITCLFDTGYSLFQTHYIGGMANIIRSKDDRRKASYRSTLVAVVGRMFLQAVLIPAFIILGNPSSYTTFAMVGVIVLVIATLVFQPGIHENEFVKKRYLQIYEFLHAKEMPYFQFLKTAIKQKNYRTWAAAMSLATCGSILATASLFYFINDVLQLDLAVVTILALATIASFVPSMFFWAYVAKKTSFAKVITIGFLVVGISNLLTLFITTLQQLVIANIIGGVATGAYVSMQLSVNSDTMDEVNLACGKHVEAGAMGLTIFFLRISILMVGIIITVVHLATGYVPGASQQSDLAILGIRLHRGLFPAIFLFIASFLMWKYYDLKGEKKEQLMAALRKKGL